MLDSFYLSGNDVNTIEKNVEEPIPQNKLGNGGTMLTDVSTDDKSGSVIPLIPESLTPSDVDPNNPDPTLSRLILVKTPITGVAADQALSEPDSLRVLADGMIQNLSQPVSQPVPVLLFRNKLRYALVMGTPTPETPVDPPQGQFNLSTQAGASATAVLARLSRNVLSPDSTFAKLKAKVDAAKSSYGHIVPTSKLPILTALSTNSAYKGELTKLAPLAFNQFQRTFTTGSSTLGSIGKGFTDKVAANVAIIESNLKATSNAGEAPTNGVPEHKVVSKIVGVLKGEVNVVKKVSDLAGKGIDAATKIVSGGAKDIKELAKGAVSVFSDM